MSEASDTPTTPGADTPKIKIFVLNNEGEGFANKIEIPQGTTVQDVFKSQMGEMAVPSKFKIKLNRMPCSASDVLNEGDRLSFTPTKIDAA